MELEIKELNSRDTNIPSSSIVRGLLQDGLLGLELPDELRLTGLQLTLCLSTGLDVLCPMGLLDPWPMVPIGLGDL